MRSRRGLAFIASLAVLGYAAMRARLRRYEIVESSMEPQLQPGDYVITRHHHGAPERGTIVILEHPNLPGFEIVKRIVGLPGEKIVIGNGFVHADGAILAEPWADGPTRPDSEWDLGPEEVFVLGDNRAASAADSRTIGPVDVTAIAWKVIARYWPASAAGWIRP